MILTGWGKQNSQVLKTTIVHCYYHSMLQPRPAFKQVSFQQISPPVIEYRPIPYTQFTIDNRGTALQLRITEKNENTSAIFNIQ